MVKRLYIDLTVPSELEPEKSPPKRRRGPPRKAKNNIEKDSRTVVLPPLPALTPPPAPSPEPCFACNNTTSISYAEILGLDSEHSGCTVCMRCIISTICHSLSGQKALCPVPTCQKEFEDEEVQLLVSEEDYQE